MTYLLVYKAKNMEHIEKISKPRCPKVKQIEGRGWRFNMFGGLICVSDAFEIRLTYLLVYKANSMKHILKASIWTCLKVKQSNCEGYIF